MNAIQVVEPLPHTTEASETPRFRAASRDVAAETIRHAARWLDDYQNTSTTPAAYARDLGLAAVVEHYDLADVVRQLPARMHGWFRRGSGGRRPAAPDLAWVPACLALGLDPLEDVTVQHVRSWLSEMADRTDAAGKPVLSKAARARRLSAVSAWLQWAFEEGITGENPAARVNRGRAGLRMDRHRTGTRALSGRQLDVLVYAADRLDGPHHERTAALVSLMAGTGCRVAEAIHLDVADYYEHAGQKVVEFTRKGNFRQRVPVSPPVAVRLDAYLATRTDLSGEVVPIGQAGASRRDSAPLFATTAWRTGGGRRGGGQRLSAGEVWSLLRRVARSHPELEDTADWLHPHAVRHSVATRLLDAGVPIQFVQELLGHADPATTQLYNHAREALHNSPAWRQGQFLEQGLAELYRESV